jgi:hypothetical protein
MYKRYRVDHFVRLKGNIHVQRMQDQAVAALKAAGQSSSPILSRSVHIQGIGLINATDNFAVRKHIEIMTPGGQAVRTFDRRTDAAG